MDLVYSCIDSPIGELYVVASERGLTELRVRCARYPRPEPEWIPDAEPLSAALEQLRAWFAGERFDFKLPLHLEGTTFQRKVWDALAEIPYAETVSYGELAEQIGHPRAARAVGSANGANPVPIILPCHRVIASGGGLGGYGYGLPLKRQLLDLERGFCHRAQA